MREDNSSTATGKATAAGSVTIIDGTAIGIAISGMTEIVTVTAVKHPVKHDCQFSMLTGSHGS